MPGTVPQVANPLRFSDSAMECRRAPPTLGQHNEEILKRLLGLTDAEIARLSQGAIL